MGLTKERPKASKATLRADRRRKPRLAAPTSIAMLWRCPTGRMQVLHARGTIRDISPTGVYFYGDQFLPQGAPVEFDLAFPSEMTAAEPVRLHGKGTFVRNERVDRRFGTAIRIHSHSLTPIRRDELPSPAAERRAQARVQPPALLFADYPGLESVVRDLSPSGAFIEDERPLPVGRVFTLHLRGSPLSQALELRAIVRRVEPHVGMAVEFLSMSEEALKSLRVLTGNGH